MEITESGFTFSWDGSQYCDIARPGGEPFDVLNLWDSERDCPAITSRRELRSEAREWVRDYSRDYIVNGY